MSYEVGIGISNKHVHLSRKDVDVLFGEGHKLTPIKDLVQPGQFACDERVDIVGPKGTLKGVRVLGPERPETQVNLGLRVVRDLDPLDLQVLATNSIHGQCHVARARELQLFNLARRSKNGDLGALGKDRRVAGPWVTSKIGRAHV